MSRRGFHGLSQGRGLVGTLASWCTPMDYDFIIDALDIGSRVVLALAVVVGVLVALVRRVRGFWQERIGPTIGIRGALMIVVMIELLLMMALQLTTINQRLDAPVRVADVGIDFGSPVSVAFDEPQEASSAGFVSATLEFSRVGTQTARAIACGYVGPTRDSLSPGNRTSLATLLATSSMQCRDGSGCGPAGVYIPNAGLSMPVQAGQWWIVTGCGGAAEQATRVFYHELLTIALIDQADP